MAFAAAAGGVAAGGASGLIDFGLGQWAQSEAYKKQRKMSKKQWLWMVQGMRAAGLNPALAFGAQPGVPQIGTPSFHTDLMEGAQRGVSTARAARAQNDELRGVKAGADASESNAVSQRNAATASKYLPWMTQQEVRNKYLQGEESRSRISLQEAERLRELAQRDVANVQADLMRFSIPEARAGAEIYEAAPWVKALEKFLGLTPRITGGGGRRKR